MRQWRFSGPVLGKLYASMFSLTTPPLPDLAVDATAYRLVRLDSSYFARTA